MKARGVTLMELLVVMGVFSLTVLMTSGIFLLSNRAQRRVLAATAAQADLRFALEAIVREVRSGKIDYDYYATTGGIDIPASRLVLQNSSGQREIFYREENASVCQPAPAPCLAVSMNGAAQSLTSVGDTVTGLAFYVSPQSDPFTVSPSTGQYGSNLQPTVTIAVQGKTTAVGAADVQAISAQTTVASRIYAR